MKNNQTTTTQATTQTKVSVHEYYQAKEGMSAYFSMWGGKWQFDTYEEIVDAISEFRADPRKQWPAMSDENVEKSKNRIYTIQKIVTTTIDITNII